VWDEGYIFYLHYKLCIFYQLDQKKTDNAIQTKPKKIIFMVRFKNRTNKNRGCLVQISVLILETDKSNRRLYLPIYEAKYVSW
jgi:hypothetical protein